MALAFSVDGKVVISDGTTVEKSTSFSGKTGTISEHNSGVITIAAASPSVTTTISLGGLTTVHGIFLKAILNGAATPELVDVITSDSTAAVAFRCSECTLVVADTPSLTGLWVKAENNVAVDVHYCIAGV